MNNKISKRQQLRANISSFEAVRERPLPWASRTSADVSRGGRSRMSADVSRGGNSRTYADVIRGGNSRTSADVSRGGRFRTSPDKPGDRPAYFCRLAYNTMNPHNLPYQRNSHTQKYQRNIISYKERSLKVLYTL